MADQFPVLPQLSPAQVQLSRFLAGRQTTYNVTIAEHQGNMVLSPGEQPTALGYQLMLNVNNVPLALELDSQGISLLLPGKLDHNAINTLPLDLLIGALHYSLDSSLQQLAGMLGVPVALTGIEAGTNNPSSTGLMLTANMGGNLCNGRIEVNETTMALLGSLPENNSQDIPDIPVWASLELGRSLLHSSEIHQLETGDVVFLQQHVTGQHLIIRLNSHTAFLAEAEGNQITVQQRMAPMEDEQHQESPEDHQEQAPQSGVDLSDISVELFFEIGHQQFNASDLRGLQPGFVFELDRPIEQPVRIRANGKVIAECQLVQIENRLGAKITQLKK